MRFRNAAYTTDLSVVAGLRAVDRFAACFRCGWSDAGAGWEGLRCHGDWDGWKIACTRLRLDGVRLDSPLSKSIGQYVSSPR